MKKIIVVMLLIFAVKINAQQSIRAVWYDSLKSNRTAITVDMKGFLYVEVVFKSLAVTDSLRIYSMTDSVRLQNGKSFTADTIPAYFRNLSTYTETDSGFITGMVSPLKILVLDPDPGKIYIKVLDANLTTTIYVRIKGVTY